MIVTYLVYYFHSLKKNVELVSGGTGQMSKGLFFIMNFYVKFIVPMLQFLKTLKTHFAYNQNNIYFSILNYAKI